MNIKLIKNVDIITMDSEKRIIEDGVLVIENNLIKEIGTLDLINEYKNAQIIDGNGGILMPGMVNSHTHSSMIVFRSLADDVPDRLNRFLFPLEKKLVDKELVYKGAKYGIAEMLLSGVTTFADMYFFEDEVARAAKEMGIRAVLGETILNFPSPDSKEAYGGITYSDSFIKKWLDDELITPSIAPHAPYSLDDEHLKKSYEMAKKYDVPMMMHLAEMDYEIKKYREECNMTPVEYLDSIGVLDSNLIAAHCILVSEKDIELLKEKNVGISHNVGANSKAAKGVAPVYKMYKDGLDIGLGTDGPMSGNTLDIITQMGQVAKVHKLFNEDRSLFPAKEVVEMATLGGAKALKLEKKIGTIEVGKCADLVILETESVNMQPIYDHYSVMVYSANPSNVDTVIVNGQILVRDKKLTKANLREIQNDVREMNKIVSDIAKTL